MDCKYIELPSVEAKYRRLEALGKELGVPVPAAFLEMMVTMPGGEITHWHRQRSHSWTRNAYNYLFMAMTMKDPSDSTFGAGKLSYKDTTTNIRYGTIYNGTSLVNFGNTYPVDVDTPSVATVPGLLTTANDDGKGIQVGGGINGESFEDYVLQNKILTGTISGKIAYAAHSLHSIAYDAPSKTLSDAIVRFFNNNSGATITVNEVGLVIGIDQPTSAFSVGLYMASRDHLSNTVNVLDTGQLKVTYTLSLAYPA